MTHAPVLTRRFAPGKAVWPVETHLYAPLLSRRLHHQTPGQVARIKTFIDYSHRLLMEQLALDYSVNLPPHTSLAILAMNNETGGRC